MKKAQAAMEFLMTYGWAILVVLVAIGALAYFGVLNPSRFLPSSCTIAPGISCDDFKVTNESVELVLKNGMGADLTGVTVAVTGCTTSAGATWNDGAILGGSSLTLDCTDNGEVGSRFKQDVNIAYTTSAGIAHTVAGQLTTEVE